MGQNDKKPLYLEEAAIIAFVQEYLIDFKPAQAVLRANLKQTSERARDIAKKIMETAFFNQEVRRVLDKAEKSTLVTRDRVIAKLWEEANSDDVLFNKSGSRIRALIELAQMKGFYEDAASENAGAPVVNVFLNRKKVSQISEGIESDTNKHFQSDEEIDKHPLM